MFPVRAYFILIFEEKEIYGELYIYIVIQIRVVGYFIYLRLTLWDP